MRGRFFVLVLFAVVASWGWAEPLSLEDAVEKALKGNVDYQTALLTVDRFRNSLSWVNWNAISVSATQKQTSAVGTSTTTLGLNLPLFDQLEASASVDQDKNAQVSVTVNPLAHSDATTQARLSYEKALLAASQARVSLETAVRKAYLTQVVAEAQVEVQTRRTTLKETSYVDAKARYAKGTVTLTEVRTALLDWIQARTTQTAAERDLVKAQADLAAKLQGEIEVMPLRSLALEASVESLGPLDVAVRGTSIAVKVHSLEADAAQAKADAIWSFDPRLTISGTAWVPLQGNLTWVGSVTLTLALGDWQGTDKAVAEKTAELAHRTFQAQQISARSLEALALLAALSARDTVETRTLALAQAKELLIETRLLAKAGEATVLDIDDADLGVTSAEVEVFGAWADLYGARLDLAALRSLF